MRVHHIIRDYLYYRYIQSWMAVIDLKTHDRTTYTFMEVIEIIVFKYDFICTRSTLFESLVLKHQAISIHSADQIFIAMDKKYYIYRKQYQKVLPHFENIYPGD